MEKKIIFRKRIFETTNEVISILNDCDFKQVEILTINKEEMKVSLNGLTKKEIKSFLMAGFDVTQIGTKDILIYEASKPTTKQAE